MSVQTQSSMGTVGGGCPSPNQAKIDRSYGGFGHPQPHATGTVRGGMQREGCTFLIFTIVMIITRTQMCYTDLIFYTQMLVKQRTFSAPQ